MPPEITVIVTLLGVGFVVLLTGMACLALYYRSERRRWPQPFRMKADEPVNDL